MKIIVGKKEAKILSLITSIRLTRSYINRIHKLDIKELGEAMTDICVCELKEIEQ